MLERVFEPFLTTKDVGKGSGLGLSMVFGFVQQSGGHVSIASQVGKGTSVTIVLPAIISQPVEPGAEAIIAPPTGGRERLLVVEDEPAVLQYGSTQLLNLGYEVTAAANRPDAVRTLQADQGFDLLLTDLVLPKGMSGIDLSQVARGIKPGLKVVYTSGYSEEVFRQHGRAGDDIPLLRKPFKRAELAEMLRAVLDGTQP